MKKAIITVLVLGILTSLAACGPSKAPGTPANIPVTDILDEIVAVMAAELREQGYTDQDFENDPLPGYNIKDLTKEDIDLEEDGLILEGKVIFGFMNINADQIIILKAAEGKAQQLKAKIQTYNQERLGFWRDYNSTQAQKIQGAIVQVRGDYVYYLCLANPQAVETAITDLLK